MGLTEYHLFADLRRYQDTLGYILVGFTLTIIATSMTATANTPYLPDYCFILQLE